MVISVVPFFWQTKTFIWGTASVVALGAGFSLWRWERRRARRKLEVFERRHALERERARIAQDLHDDLGTSLTEVGLLSALARRPAASTVEAAAHLDDIGQKVRSMVTALDEIVWAVSPKNDTVPAVAGYLSQFADRFLQTAAIRCRLDVAPDLPARPVSSEQRHQLFMAFREALNNIVRHAQAQEVRVRVEVVDDVMVVRMEDDGRGLEPGPLAAGADGLSNLRERLDRLGGTCNIESQPGRGTSVRFTLPLR